LDGEWIEQSEIQNGTLRAENEEKVSLVIKGTRLVAVHGKSRDEMTFTVDVSKSPSMKRGHH